jgi:hypothetical protein
VSTVRTHSLGASANGAPGVDVSGAPGADAGTPVIGASLHVSSADIPITQTGSSESTSSYHVTYDLTGVPHAPDPSASFV